MDRHAANAPFGLSWRHVYFAMFLALGAASFLIVTEIRHGIGLAGGILAVADSAHVSSELARRAISRQDTTQALILANQHAIAQGVLTITDRLDAIDRRSRMERRRQIHDLKQSVARVQVAVDSVATVVDSVSKLVPTKKK